MSKVQKDCTQIHCREHPDPVLLEDYIAGHKIICTDCGLVVWVSADRALNNAFKEINEMADRISLPRRIVYRANDLFKMVHNDRKKLKEQSNDAIASACLYIACRQEGVPRTFREICAVSKKSRKQIGRCFRMLCKFLDTSVEVIPIGNFISRYCSNLDLPNGTQRAAIAIAEAAVKLRIVAERSPITVAAAAIYMVSQASEIKRSQKEIGDVTGVAVQTIRQAYKLMYPRAEELLPMDF